jgi:hypothetical protein
MQLSDGWDKADGRLGQSRLHLSCLREQALRDTW